MTLAEARELGFRTFAEMERKSFFALRENNVKAFSSLKEKGEIEKAIEGLKVVEAEIKKEIYEVNFRKYIELPISGKKDFVKALEALRAISKKFDGKVFNKSIPSKMGDDLKKAGFNCVVFVSSSDALKIAFFPSGESPKQEACITYMDSIVYVNEGQVRQRLSYDALSHEISITIEGIKDEIKQLENSKNEAEIRELNNEIKETREKLDRLQEKARNTYDAVAVNNIYKEISYYFFHR